MRKRGRSDENQVEIINALRAAGASVLCLSGVGSGCPDLLVGIRGNNLLIEVKDGNKPPSHRVLTKDQRAFFAQWRGHAIVVKDVDEALAAIRGN